MMSTVQTNLGTAVVCRLPDGTVQAFLMDSTYQMHVSPLVHWPAESSLSSLVTRRTFRQLDQSSRQLVLSAVRQSA